jgi:alkylated DNA nucleotide flippase Atl1
VDDEYLEAVLDLVEQIPAGRAMTYGTVAEVVADLLVAAGGRGRGGPRQVGHVMARAGGGVPWWRVVNAGGRSPTHLEGQALAHWVAEGTPLTTDRERIVLRQAIWFPDDDLPGDAADGR